MNKLDEICVYHIQAQRTAFPTRKLERCRVCLGYDETCLNYLKLERTELPRRQGRFAVLEIK